MMFFHKMYHFPHTTAQYAKVAWEYTFSMRTIVEQFQKISCFYYFCDIEITNEFTEFRHL